MESLTQFLPLIFLFFIFYFLIIRPQKKQQKEHKNMIENLAKSDKILTTGGLYAEIIKIKSDDEVVKIKMGENIIVKLDKSYILKKLNNVSTKEETKPLNLLKKS